MVGLADVGEARRKPDPCSASVFSRQQASVKEEGMRKIGASFGVLFVVVGLAGLGTRGQQAVPGDATKTSVETPSSPTVFAEVITQQSDGTPLRQLKKEDLRLYNDRHEVALTAFRYGGRFETRPVALWLVTLCNEGGKIAGSRVFSGKEALFRPALEQMDKRDTVGVAHWCDNGDAQLDLLPTKDRDQAVHVLGKTMEPISFNLGANSNMMGENAFEKMVRMILQDAREKDMKALPVIVFLYGGSGSHLRDNLDYLIDDISAAPAIVFGVQDEIDLTNRVGRSGQEGHFVNYMAEQTGGQYLTATPERYATALEMILMEVHFRYELGFTPASGSGRHEIKVELAKGIREEHKGAQLRYCAQYVAASQEAKGR
jgi:hypothetical protein